MNHKINSYFYLGLCIISWGLIPVVSKRILVELDNIQMLFYSTIFSCLVMGILTLVSNKTKQLKTYTRTDYLKMGLLGFLGTYLYYMLLYAALALISASEVFI